ncbi:hypothetical protein JCM19275_3334 [Nonlabens ulvanivorans]|uniref:Uncharacterized protein n=1 Tax=Nonlabens ulvanivorans TaxID=906888 RepID=A0A090WGJ2_NONUL|nr:hypothetical protein JCM19275_3334 [Nonlabens ulvanivorans]
MISKSVRFPVFSFVISSVGFTSNITGLVEHPVIIKVNKISS